MQAALTPYTANDPVQGMAQCGAKTRQGGTCKTRPMANGRCRMHGGKSLGGLTSPSLRHGRYSKSLPTRLADRYHEAATDPELLSQREDIALLDSRLSDVLEQVSNQESGELWQQLHQAKQQYYKATGRDKEQQQADALQSIWYLIGEGYNERQSWHEIRSILQERKVLVESERKRLIDMQQMMTATQANLLLGAVAHVVKQSVTEHITNPDERKRALQAISTELGALVNVGS